MSKTFFIADVHLSIHNTQKKRLVLSFIDTVIREKGDLYILGDFFEFWANNSKIVKNNLVILNKFQELTLSGQKAGFLFGNPDCIPFEPGKLSIGCDRLPEDRSGFQVGTWGQGRKIVGRHGGAHRVQYTAIHAHDKRFVRTSAT